MPERISKVTLHTCFKHILKVEVENRVWKNTSCIMTGGNGSQCQNNKLFKLDVKGAMSVNTNE